MHDAFHLPVFLDWYPLLVVIYSLERCPPLKLCLSVHAISLSAGIIMSPLHPTGSVAVAVREVPDVTH